MVTSRCQGKGKSIYAKLPGSTPSRAADVLCSPGRFPHHTLPLALPPPLQDAGLLGLTGKCPMCCRSQVQPRLYGISVWKSVGADGIPQSEAWWRTHPLMSLGLGHALDFADPGSTKHALEVQESCLSQGSPLVAFQLPLQI